MTFELEVCAIPKVENVVGKCDQMQPIYFERMPSCFVHICSYFVS